MQNQGGAQATTAIQASDRQFRIRLTADWNRNGLYDHALSDLSRYARDVTTDRSLKGSAPEEVTLIEGAGAAQMDLTLSGEYLGTPFAGIFSPYQSKSPFFHKEIIGIEMKYEIGVQTSIGMVWYPQFVGNLRTITPNRGSGLVTMTALDRVEIMRRPIIYPVWAIYDYHASRGIIEAQLCDTQWVIDHTLRECKISPTPYRPTSREENGLADDAVTGPQIWINGTGSWLPSIGWLDNWNVQEFPYTEDTGEQMYQTLGSVNPASPEPTTAPLALAALGNTGDSILKYWASDRDRVNSRGMQMLGFTINLRGPRSTYYLTAPEHEVLHVRLGDFYVISVMIQNGQVWTEFEDETLVTTAISSKVTIPTTGDYQRVNVVWDYFHPTGPKVYVGAGVNTNNSGNYQSIGSAKTNVAQVDELKGLFTVDHRVSLNDIYYTATNFGSLTVSQALQWGGRTPVYTAVLDNGTNGISYMPVHQGDDAWEVAAEAAGTEFGSIFWDEAGVFRFWNAQRMKDLRSVIARELTLDEVTGLEITNSLDSVRNIWTVDSGKRRAFEAASYESNSEWEFYTEGLTRKLFRIWSDEVLSPNPGKITQYGTIPGGFYPEWNDILDHGYVVQWLSGGVWAENDARAGVDIYVYFDNEGKVVVNIWNGYPEPARLAKDTGGAAFRVGGTKIETSDDQITIFKNRASINTYGGKNLRLDGDFYQKMVDYQGMITNLMPGTEKPVPTTQNITIAGDPRLQFGDTLRIRDREGFGDRFDVQIQGIRRTYSVDSGLTDTLTVEMIAAPAGIWDSNQYGIWGSTFIWGN
jgi:hypothetical protein